jgi:C4-dicarboxylate-specific signal transduction histidine kinase
MTFRYLLALAVVAIVAVSTFVLGEYNVARERDNATEVNVAGRQRMLSQRIALLTHELIMVDEQARAAPRVELSDVVDLMQRSHDALINGDPDLGVPGNPSAGIQALLFDPPTRLDTQVREFLATARSMAGASPSELAALERRVTTAAAQLVQSLDTAVAQYVLDSEGDQRSHRALDAIGLGATVIALVMMGLLIFRPMVRRVRRETDAQEALTQSLEKRVAERTEELTIAMETLARDAEERAVLVEIGRVITSAPDIDEIYERFAAVVGLAIPCDRLAIGTPLNNNFSEWKLAYCSGRELPGFDTEATYPWPDDIGYSFIDISAPFVVDQQLISAAPSWKDINQNALDVGLHSWMIAPLIRDAQVIGRLDFRSAEPDAYGFSEMAVAERVAQQIAGAVANARLHAGLEREARDRGERIKELTCMYGVLRSVQAHGNMGDIARDAVALLPPGWQYPEITAGRITFDGVEYFAGAFEETEWRLTADIVIEEQKRGAVEVVYLEERPPAVEGPFLKEERDLIDGIARTLGETGERSQLAEQVRVRQAETMTAGRLASIGELAAGVAHEINNPINSIINYADLVLDQVGAEGERGQYLQGIIREGERIGSITRNLLTFARDMRETHSPARVADILDATLELLGRRLQTDSIDLRIDVPEDLPKVRCRSQQIQQVFMNLIANARHALNARYPHEDSDKILEISAGVIDMDGEPGVRVAFHDHGVGIPESALPSLFDPFFSTKPEGEGTGLGLSISHGIIRDHQGRIHFESVEGEYTKATIDLLVKNRWNLES